MIRATSELDNDLQGTEMQYTLAITKCPYCGWHKSCISKTIITLHIYILTLRLVRLTTTRTILSDRALPKGDSNR